jgi:hypothetical protein
MQKMHFDTQIDAPPDEVWDAVVNDASYREWTRPFHPTSRFEGGWNQGDRIRLLATSDQGQTEGMVSEIAESRRPSFISIRHLGIVKDGVEDTTSDAARAWAPAHENYTLVPVGAGTRFEVDLDVADGYVEMMSDMWPKALAALKHVAERGVRS